MKQFVDLLKKDMGNFEAEPEQMRRFMSQLLRRIGELEEKEAGKEK